MTSWNRHNNATKRLIVIIGTPLFSFPNNTVFSFDSSHPVEEHSFGEGELVGLSAYMKVCSHDSEYSRMFGMRSHKVFIPCTLVMLFRLVDRLKINSKWNVKTVEGETLIVDVTAYLFGKQ